MGTIQFRRFDASKALANDVNRNCNEHPECKSCPYERYESCKLLYLYEKTRDEYYRKGRADAIDDIVQKAFKWLMAMDIINCDGCDYKSECVNRNMNCFDVMTEKFFEQLKEQNNGTTNDNTTITCD